MENTRVASRLKQILLVVHLRCAGVCFSALTGTFLGSWGTSCFPQLSCWCLTSILPRGAGGEAGRGLQSREVLVLVVSAPCVHPCKLHLGLASPPETCPAHRHPRTLQGTHCHVSQPGRHGGESVNVPSHNKPLCMGGPEIRASLSSPSPDTR